MYRMNLNFSCNIAPDLCTTKWFGNLNILNTSFINTQSIFGAYDKLSAICCNSLCLDKLKYILKNS